MPTDLPVRVVPRSQVVDTKESIQALTLFYFGMALLALLLVMGERSFGVFRDQTFAESMLQATSANLLIDENGDITLPTGP
jgi:hypothetical protein